MILSMHSSALQLGGVLASPLGQLLSALVVVGVVILVLRFALRIAWRLVTIGAIIVGVLALATFLLPGLL